MKPKALNKSYDKPTQCIKKQRHCFANKGLYQSYGFSSSHVWMWEWDYKEGWVWRIDAFELWCWRRFLRVLWIVRRSNQSILKEISPEYSLEELMLKLKLQYFGHLMQSVYSLEKTLMMRKIEVRRRRGHQRMRLLDSITTQWTWVSATLGDNKRQGGLACCSSWGHKESDMTERLNWTELKHWLFSKHYPRC